jgi:hypothetical protein
MAATMRLRRAHRQSRASRIRHDNRQVTARVAVASLQRIGQATRTACFRNAVIDV